MLELEWDYVGWGAWVQQDEMWLGEKMRREKKREERREEK